jgi:hypothetical protein
MHARRLACVLLGAWLAGGLFMTLVATENFQSVDRLLAKPSPAAQIEIKALGPALARQLLRYQVAEQNRWYFEFWEIVQLFLGALVFFFLLFGTPEGKFALSLALAMIAMVLVQRFLLTPEIIALGRLLDFAPDIPSGDRNKFRVLHATYMIVEMIKWGLGFVLTVRLVARRHSRSGDSWKELDMVDEPNYRHIDR